MKTFRLALARALFEAGLWKLSGLALPENGVLFLKDRKVMVFRNNGRVETGKGRVSIRSGRCCAYRLLTVSSPKAFAESKPLLVGRVFY